MTESGEVAHRAQQHRTHNEGTQHMASKWIVVGTAGVLGLGLIATGAVVAAGAMEMQSRGGESVPAGPIVGVGGGVGDGVLGDEPVHLVERPDGALTIASASTPGQGTPPAVQVPARPTVPAPVQPAPAPVAPPAPAPADSPDSPPSPPSPPSAVSVASAD